MVEKIGAKPTPEQLLDFLRYQIEIGKFGENISYTPKNEEVAKLIELAENLLKEPPFKEIPKKMEQLRALLQETIRHDPLKHSNLKSGKLINTYLEHKITGYISAETIVELSSIERGDYDGQISIICSNIKNNLEVRLYIQQDPKKPISVVSNYRLTKDGPKIFGLRPYIFYPDKVQDGEGEVLCFINQAKSAATEYLEGRLQITNPSTKFQTP
ncbi:MAG: hypothetical protein Q7R43_01760 [Candidatus Daviesbacteria bacterium]|nr:hypothetical protein [Candidatus Daviesbacteria bacterium]